MNECKECGENTPNYQYCDSCFTETGTCVACVYEGNDKLHGYHNTAHECELSAECNTGECGA